ncbi:DMT family transporter [Bacillus sp. FJAT-45037]|uniref:DMT family transporter n=1 Tax=Bacillus sp. FJAT-45037 TaxID=2011007 RepID=UPI000C248776|nr:multidrug resistance efflux transporter family protein [Bacillus sp. FJAT-45037]
MKEIAIGIVASMFFAVTFILNRSMDLAGGSWYWSSSLRFLFMFPFLLLIVVSRNTLLQVLREIRHQPLAWMMWSFVGFVLFYAPLTFAAAYGPGWLIAGTWQLTIVAGVLLTPLFYKKVQQGDQSILVRQKIPLGALLISMLIFLGVVLIQWQHASQLSIGVILLGVVPVAIAAFAYPLGNRKMMELCGGRLDTFGRVFGMTLASLPFWVIIGIFGYVNVGPPSPNELLQTFTVAICSGVIATTLFFIATDRAKDHQGSLAAVEATQSTQVLFVMAGEVLLLSTPLPSGIAVTGLGMIVGGMLLYSLYTRKIGRELQFKKAS